MTEQPDLFDLPLATAVLREEQRFGTLDAKTGLSLRNRYSDNLSGGRLAAYELAFREARRGMAADA